MAKRNILAYGLLTAAAVLVSLWQCYEHMLAREAAEKVLLNRALDVSNTLGVVLRSQGFFGLVRQPRLEEALGELIKTGDLKSVALLYASGQVAAAAGEVPDIGVDPMIKTGPRWTADRFIVVNPVDLGTNAETGEEPRTSIVIPKGDEGRFRPPPGDRGERRGNREDRRGERPMEPREPRDPPPEPPKFGRPPWLSEQQYLDLVNRQGVHYFVLSLSTDGYWSTVQRDLYIRASIVMAVLVAVAGLGLAWRNAERTAALQLNLLRADEMNRHLQEMNLAAAGLAHETRNPLNIIRGLAQLMSTRSDAPGDMRETSWRIADEVDRVTDRLNQFLAYSRPAEANPVPTNLTRVVSDVARALETDREDKGITFELTGPELEIEADESLLRQIVFNLLLNAIQVLPQGGHVAVVIHEEPDGTARMEVRDNGPGVPESVREQIFRPYFTTSKQGTGLGLAVVEHAVHAHRWSIACLSGEDGGAVFRLTKMKLA